MTGETPVLARYDGDLSPSEWTVDSCDGINHALRWAGHAEDGYVRNIMTRCEYGQLRTGQAAYVKRGTPTCLACMVPR